MARKVQGRGKLRFRASTGERYRNNGNVRCHAVSRRRLKELRETYPDITADEAFIKFPEMQCKNTAKRGYYVCKFHFTSGGVNVKSQVKDVFGYLKGDIAHKWRIAVNDPELFNQRNNVALLSARNATLFEDVNAAGLSTTDRLRKLNKVLELIDASQVIKARNLLSEVLDGLSNDKNAWDEIRKNMSGIKDLSNAEMTRQKEMRQHLTVMQAMAMIESHTQALIAAVERFVDDPIILEGIFREVVDAARNTAGTPRILISEDASE